jgi:hypothetical protein
MAFSSSYDLRGLLHAVKDVALAADPDEPLRLSQSRWNHARAKAGHPDAPNANKIASRLALAWPEVLALAFQPARAQDYAIGHRFGSGEADWLTQDRVIYVLKVVALRNKTSVIDRAIYRRTIPQIQGTRRDDEAFLPNENQVATMFGGSFEAACRAAGLTYRGQAGSLPTVNGIVDLIEACYLAHGAEPTAGELERFARANDLKHPRRGKPYTVYLADWKQARSDRDLDVPDGPPPTNARPDYSSPVDPDLIPVHLQTNRFAEWGPEDRPRAVREVAIFLATRTGTQKDSRRAYEDYSTGNRAIPNPGVLDRKYEGFAAIRTEARALVQELGVETLRAEARTRETAAQQGKRAV